jgi:hypothetical protein
MAQIRGPFPLPISSPQTTGGPAAVMLAPGQTWYPPPGEYMIWTGFETIVQVADDLNNMWRNYAGPQSSVQLSMDGFNYRLINLSGVCIGAYISNVGSGGTNGIGPLQTGAAVSFGSAPAGTAGLVSGRAAQGYAIVGGSVPAPTITQAGSGFITAPLVVCDPPPDGGIQATFNCTITYSTGALLAVTQVNPGAGYTSIPQFYIIPQPQFYQGSNQYPPVAGTSPPSPGGTGGAGLVPPPGLINPANAWAGSPYQANLVTGTTGALLTGNALTGSGTLTGIVMTDFGAGYQGSTVPTITITGVGAATATALMSLCSTVGIGVASAVTGSTGAAIGVSGGGALTNLGTVSGAGQNLDNSTLFSRPIRVILTSTTGATATLEDPGFGLQGGATVYVGGTTLSTLTSSLIGGRNDVSIVQAMVQ